MDATLNKSFGRADLLGLLKKYNEQTLHNNPAPNSDFVGAIADEEDAPEFAPVALVIGANYGQIKTSKCDTRQRESLINYARKIEAIAQNFQLPAKGYHVVLWNFYPYLTQQEWKQEYPRAIDEAKSIFTFGWHDPLNACRSLVDVLQPDLIVLHGAHAAVAPLAMAALRSYQKCIVAGNNMGRGLHLKSFVRLK